MVHTYVTGLTKTLKIKGEKIDSIIVESTHPKNVTPEQNNLGN